jgi:hypothetical protein
MKGSAAYWLAFVLASTSVGTAMFAQSPQGAPPKTSEADEGEARRAKVPAPEVVEAKRAALRELYGSTKARGKPELRVLARSFLDQVAASLAADADARYAALVEALELAIRASDLATALESVERIDAGYEPVERELLRFDVALRIAGEMKAEETPEVAAFALDLIEGLLGRDLPRRQDVERGEELYTAIKPKVQKWTEDETKQRLAAARKALDERTKLVAAFETLEATPDDPAANRAVGFWRTFVRGELERGLELLAKGPEEPLTRCAQLDRANPEGPGDQLAVGEAWLAWSKTRTSRSREVAEARANHWFSLAWTQLTGAARVEVEKKMKATARSAGRALARSGTGSPAESELERSISSALAWLVAHQGRDGSWDCDGFNARCACQGVGSPVHDVGTTGLAVFALLSRGDPEGSERIDQALARGLRWLEKQQDRDTGLLGERAGHDFLYDHAIGALALAAAYRASGDAALGARLGKAIDLILEARNPYGAWRYDLPPTGDSDTSVTAWMVAALVEARNAGAKLDSEALQSAFAGAQSWIDEVTDPVLGRTGYDSFGSLSSRTPANEHFPREKGEAMTAAGLATRLLLGQAPGQDEALSKLLKKQAEVIAARPPVWDEEGFGIDLYSWYYATQALYGLRGAHPTLWAAWSKKLEAALLESQCRDEHARGSWDPVSAWSFAGGRVYSTAMAVLALTVPSR